MSSILTKNIINLDNEIQNIQEKITSLKIKQVNIQKFVLDELQTENDPEIVEIVKKQKNIVLRRDSLGEINFKADRDYHEAKKGFEKNNSILLSLRKELKESRRDLNELLREKNNKVAEGFRTLSFFFESLVNRFFGNKLRARAKTSSQMVFEY